MAKRRWAWDEGPSLYIRLKQMKIFQAEAFQKKEISVLTILYLLDYIFHYAHRLYLVILREVVLKARVATGNSRWNSVSPVTEYSNDMLSSFESSWYS